jgi:4-aminobutyrate aminotransferase-like enzyme
MIGVELESSEAADRLTALFLEAGLVTDRFLFRPSAFRIAPPLVITEEQVSETGESIRKCLDNL